MAFSGMNMQEDALPDTSVEVPEFPEVSQTDPETTTTINAVNMNDYVGSWMVDRYNSYMDVMSALSLKTTMISFTSLQMVSGIKAIA